MFKYVYSHITLKEEELSLSLTQSYFLHFLKIFFALKI